MRYETIINSYVNQALITQITQKFPDMKADFRVNGDSRSPVINYTVVVVNGKNWVNLSDKVSKVDGNNLVDEYLEELSFLVKINNASGIILDGFCEIVTYDPLDYPGHVLKYKVLNNSVNGPSVIKHQRDGELFYLSPDQTEYISITDTDVLSKIEQARRLKTTAPIPTFILVRDQEFNYSRLVDVIKF